MSELVSVEDHGQVRHLILDRPEKRNAFNRELVLALREAAREAADDHDVHCVVLRGDGAAFSAGIDVFELAGLAGTEKLRPFRRDCIEAANLLEEMTKPVVAQIHGACLGLGAELALACDLRVMADDVKFGLPETKLGPDPRRRRLEPAARGRRARHRQGADHDRPHDRRRRSATGSGPRTASRQRPSWSSVTQELVDELLAASPLAVGIREARARRGREADACRILEQEVTFQQILVATDDFREAGAAFMEKRPPNFTGAPPGATKRVPSPRRRRAAPRRRSGNTQARYVADQWLAASWTPSRTAAASAAIRRGSAASARSRQTWTAASAMPVRTAAWKAICAAGMSEQRPDGHQRAALGLERQRIGPCRRGRPARRARPRPPRATAVTAAAPATARATPRSR